MAAFMPGASPPLVKTAIRRTTISITVIKQYHHAASPIYQIDQEKPFLSAKTGLMIINILQVTRQSIEQRLAILRPWFPLPQHIPQYVEAPTK